MKKKNRTTTAIMEMIERGQILDEEERINTIIKDEIKIIDLFSKTISQAVNGDFVTDDDYFKALKTCIQKSIYFAIKILGSKELVFAFIAIEAKKASTLIVDYGSKEEHFVLYLNIAQLRLFQGLSLVPDDGEDAKVLNRMFISIAFQYLGILVEEFDHEINEVFTIKVSKYAKS